MSDPEKENGGQQIDESGRNATQQRIDRELAEEGDAPVGVAIPPMRKDRPMSETIPEDPDRDGDAAEGDATDDDDDDETDESV